MRKATDENIAQIKDLIESGDVDLAEYRSYFEDEYGKATTASDDDLINIIALSEDDMEPSEWAAFIADETGEDVSEDTSPAPSVAAVGIHRQVAQSYAAVINADKTALAVLNEQVKAREVLNTYGLRLTVQFEAMFKMNAEQGPSLARLPIPRSQNDDKTKALYVSNNADKYNVPTANDPLKTVAGWFYKDLASMVGKGPEYAEMLDNLRWANDDATKGNVIAKYEYMKGMHPLDRAKDINLYVQRLGTLRLKCEEAAKIIHQKAALQEFGLAVQYLKDGDEITRSKTCIRLKDKKGDAESWNCSLATFKNYKPDKVDAKLLETYKGDKFAALRATSGKKKAAAGQGKVTAAIPLPDGKTAETWLNLFSTQCTDADFVRAWYAVCNSKGKDGKPTDEAKLRIMAVGAVYEATRSLFAAKKDYVAIYNEQKAADEAAIGDVQATQQRKAS